METQKTLKEYTDIELKALAYEQIASIEFAQKALKIVNEELQLRNSQPKTISDTKEEKKDPSVKKES